MHATTSSIIDILRTLVRFPTISERSNLDCIAWIETYLRGFGFTTVRLPDASGRKANLVASLGPLDLPGFILSGHTDVVPVDGQYWQTDPFDLHVQDGCAYGRGTCDMKGYLAVCLALAPTMAQLRLAKPVHLAFSYDEEIGCIGARPLTEWLGAHYGPQEGCFVGEPTDMQVVTAHKGNCTLQVNIRGRAAHSSLVPHNVNAIHVAAEIMSRIDEIGQRLRQEGPRDDEFDVPFSTTSIGTIKGGTASNITAQDCHFNVEFRTLPGIDSSMIVNELKAFADQTLLPRMRAINPESCISFDEIMNYPALSTSCDAPVTTLAKRISRRNSHMKVAYGTEASLFERYARTPSIVIGPGSIAQAHQANEFVKLSELEACHTFLADLLLECSDR